MENEFLKKIKEVEFEALIGSIAISITVILVIVNVFLRYFLGIQYSWIEEVSVGCFIWTVYLGATAGYRKKGLIGVDVLTKILPLKGRRILRVITNTLLLVLSASMFYLSYNYTASSDKITSALEVSYVYINSSLPVAFGLMTVYSVYFFIYDIINFNDLEIEAIEEKEEFECQIEDVMM
ncbi:TRAP transporter small permease [Cetobacterium sp. 2A]|uniref:TRAP transporter small permease n=1 Tax=unclassified Cetobacterium TaxID=2630983 RepID=UPI00163D13D8|nr:TRAP transporter small permease [Cetobacterium sp. 2A]MBC2855208.1 TRAP transporter small permease [Cetobacterium sp. 2A]